MAARAGATRTTAPSMPPHDLPRQNHRRPTQRFFDAGEVIDFAFLTVFGLIKSSVCLRQGRWRPTPRFCAADAGDVTTIRTCVGGGALAAMLSANDSNMSKVHRREG